MTPRRATTTISPLRWWAVPAVVGGIALALAPQPAQAAEPRETSGPVQPDATRAAGTVAAAARAAATAAAGQATVTVRAGDTVWAIARRHGLDIGAVLRANGLGWQSIIRPGDVLVLPAPAATVAPTTTTAAATPAPTAHTYLVQRGDTLTAIAARQHTTVVALLGANGLTWSSIIYPGQRLTIPATDAGATGLDEEQIANARLIIRIGRELGVPDRGITIALGTAMQESWLRNLDGGDRDSRGLFQQRPSTGWGTAAQVAEPVYAIRAFFLGVDGPSGPLTRGLLDIPGWQSMTYADAAQAVQISAYPDRYGRWESAATQWLRALG